MASACTQACPCGGLGCSHSGPPAEGAEWAWPVSHAALLLSGQYLTFVCSLPLVSVPGRPLVVPNQEPGRGTAASPSPCLRGAVLSGEMSFRDFSSIANLGRHIHLPVTK